MISVGCKAPYLHRRVALFQDALHRVDEHSMFFAQRLRLPCVRQQRLPSYDVLSCFAGTLHHRLDQDS